MTPTLVLGIGNRARGDDGAGPEVARRLRRRAPPDTVVTDSDGEVSRLLDLFQDRERVILVDAARSGRRPGTVRRFEAHDRELPAALLAGSTHALGLAEAVELARALGQLPAEVVVYAIEGRSYFPGDALSPEVEDAVRVVLERVLADLEEPARSTPEIPAEAPAEDALSAAGSARKA